MLFTDFSGSLEEQHGSPHKDPAGDFGCKTSQASLLFLRSLQIGVVVAPVQSRGTKAVLNELHISYFLFDMRSLLLAFQFENSLNSEREFCLDKSPKLSSSKHKAEY